MLCVLAKRLEFIDQIKGIRVILKELQKLFSVKCDFTHDVKKSEREILLRLF